MQLFLFASLKKKFPPQTIVSLLANKISFEQFKNENAYGKPLMLEIARIVLSKDPLKILLKLSKLLKKLIFFLKFIFFTNS